jgi:transcriptional regulator with XRE-family HTH domain
MRPGNNRRQGGVIPGVAHPLSDNELGVFLRSRRERVTPAEAGLPDGIGVRRTPGLRREEVATLASVSIDYYTRLERGRERRPSAHVLDALANVLKLDANERQHLHALAAHAAGNGGNGGSPTAPQACVRDTARLLLETVRPSPAAVLSRTNDLLAANPGGLALFHGIETGGNLSKWLFLDPAARTLWVDWERIAIGHVAQLRVVAGAAPDAPDVTALVTGLLANSPDFARIWARYDVKPRTTGVKRFQHPRVGRMELGYESLPLAGTDDQRFIVYLAERGTPDHDAIVLLDMVGASTITPVTPEDPGRAFGVR